MSDEDQTILIEKENQRLKEDLIKLKVQTLTKQETLAKLNNDVIATECDYFGENKSTVKYDLPILHKGSRGKAKLSGDFEINKSVEIESLSKCEKSLESDNECQMELCKLRQC